MLSKIVRVAKLPNFHLQEISSRNLIQRSKAIRWLSTEAKEPAAAAPKSENTKPPAKESEKKQRKGPVTWKSLGYAALAGAGLLVTSRLIKHLKSCL